VFPSDVSTPFSNFFRPLSRSTVRAESGQRKRPLTESGGADSDGCRRMSNGHLAAMATLPKALLSTRAPVVEDSGGAVFECSTALQHKQYAASILSDYSPKACDSRAAGTLASRDRPSESALADLHYPPFHSRAREAVGASSQLLSVDSHPAPIDQPAPLSRRGASRADPRGGCRSRAPP
jgi:hypothetical protein